MTSAQTQSWRLTPTLEAGPPSSSPREVENHANFPMYLIMEQSSYGPWRALSFFIESVYLGFVQEKRISQWTSTGCVSG